MDSLEQADAAFEKAMSGAPSTEDKAPEASTPETATDLDSQGDGVKQPTAAELMDLAKQEKFLFEGKEWTPKELKESVLRYSDYTRKTQEIAKERQYQDALTVDLAKVKSNPELAEEFKQVYPQKYHRFLEFVSSNPKANQDQGQALNQASEQPYASKLKEIDQLKAQFEELKEEKYQSKVEANMATIDSMFQKLTPKYDLAHPATVLTLAEVRLGEIRGDLKSQGYSDREISKMTVLTEQEWEKIFKHEHDRVQKLADDRQKKQFDEQKTANRRAKDVAGGGGIPGEAPKKMNMKDAEAAFMKHMTQGR